MAARYLAGALDLPLITMDLAGAISSLLGKTGQNLRQALDFARERSCVLFLDEFDALAKRRDDDTDVGELKRIVNVLLLELERWPDSGLLVLPRTPDSSTARQSAGSIASLRSDIPRPRPAVRS